MPPPQQHRILKDRRTKNLIQRLRPGDIALIHHADLDTTAARALVECKVKAVVNAVGSVSGRYPNRGPAVLLEANITLIDNIGEAAFEFVQDGQSAILEGDSIRLADGHCILGEQVTPESLGIQLESARANLSVELNHFARNTLDFLQDEQGLLFDPIHVPALKTRIQGRHVLIVVRGEGYKQDLASLGSYLKDVRPILLAVDGGADALLEGHLKPDIILGDMDSVSDEALRCGAELIVHGYSRLERQDAPGMARIEKLGLTASVFHSPGTSEDVAMLLADEMGAKLIVAVGTHFSLEEFLDKGRSGMASTFLTRLRIGSKLVDAKGIARLWSQQPHTMGGYMLVLFAFLTSAIALIWISPVGQILLHFSTIWFRWVSLWLKHSLHIR